METYTDYSLTMRFKQGDLSRGPLLRQQQWEGREAGTTLWEMRSRPSRIWVCGTGGRVMKILVGTIATRTEVRNVGQPRCVCRGGAWRWEG